MSIDSTAPAEPLDLDGLLDLIEEETHRFAAIARQTPLDARSKTYPAFTGEELTAHIGRGLRDTLATLTTGALPDDEHPIPAPPGPEVIDWLEAGLEPTVTAFRTADLNVFVPTFGGGAQPAFAMPYSLAIEVAVHRWDLGTITGDQQPIDPRLAAACFDTVLVGFLPRLAAMPFGVYLGGSVRFEATDTDDRWFFDVVDDRLVGRRDDAAAPTPASAVVRAPMSDLLLVLFKRMKPTAPGIGVEGDEDVLERLLLLGYVPDPRTTSAH